MQATTQLSPQPERRMVAEPPVLAASKMDVGPEAEGRIFPVPQVEGIERSAESDREMKVVFEKVATPQNPPRASRLRHQGWGH